MRTTHTERVVAKNVDGSSAPLSAPQLSLAIWFAVFVVISIIIFKWSSVKLAGSQKDVNELCSKWESRTKLVAFKLETGLSITAALATFDAEDTEIVAASRSLDYAVAGTAEASE